MSRPVGSKNRKPPNPRRQVQLRLSTEEHETMAVEAELAGMTFSRWARGVLRRECGMGEKDIPSDKKD